MILYTNNSNRTVYLDIPVEANSGTVDVKIVNDKNETVFEVPSVTYVDGRYSFVMPFSLTQYENVYKVVWDFEYDENSQTYDYHNESYVEIVTPILSFSEIKEIHPVATEEELFRIEKAVRNIINAHTGQTFGKFIGTKEVPGNNQRSLALPSRLISISSVNGNDDNYEIVGGGYYLNYFPWGVPPVKADYYGLHYHTGGIIHNPNNVKLGVFNENSYYTVDGVWGWEFVPEQVKEAAKLLVNDYACADANYRDRYLTSMTAADWRIQYHSGAFLKTGNVRADQLLNDYVLKHGWAVL